MVYLISINYKRLLSVDQAFCESFTCHISDDMMVLCLADSVKMLILILYYIKQNIEMMDIMTLLLCHMCVA